MAITNFQYVGFLGDFLNTYNSIDILTEQFELAKTNYDAATQKLEEYKKTFCLKNCILGFFALYGIILLLTFPFMFLETTRVVIWLPFCAIIACVIIVLSKILYTTRVLPTHSAHLQNAVNRAKRNYERTYNQLIAHRNNLETMCEGMPEHCAYPLSIYIMREAAKEGECGNIPQGIRYFTERYKTLEQLDDEASVNLKTRIDHEKALSDLRQQFLNELDEMARTLFEK